MQRLTMASSLLEFSAKNFFYLKFVGFGSFTVVDGKSVTKPVDVLFLIANMFFGFLICFWFVTHKNDFISSKSQIADYGNFVSYIASVLVSINSMFVAFIFRHRIWGMVRKGSMTIEKVSQMFVFVIKLIK